MTVFDFSTILERTETRVRDDLLGAGPKTVEELKSIEGRLRLRYKKELERKIQRAKLKVSTENGGGGVETEPSASASASASAFASDPPQGIAKASPQFREVKDAVGKATNFAGGFFAKVKGRLGASEAGQNQNPATLVDLPPVETNMTTNRNTSGLAPTSGNSEALSDGDWTGKDIASATDGITNFSIGDDDDDPDLLL